MRSMADSIQTAASKGRWVKRAWQVLCQEGLVSLWFRGLSHTIYRRVIVWSRPLDESPLALTTDLSVVISLLEPDQVDDYLQFHPGASPEDVRARLRSGHWCFVARHAGRIVHACWAAAGRVWIEYLEREIELACDEVYVYESLTAPEWRGHNIAGARSAYMARFLWTAGYRRTIAVVVPENRPALRAVEKAGYRPVGVMGYIKLGKWRHDFCRVRRSPETQSGK